MSEAEKRKVYLVGAGPGDPELLTVKAARLLSSADLVLHDDLVGPGILALASASAQVVSVGKRVGAKRITQAEINKKMVDSAQAGLSVVRLKSGDPSIFGRAGEELSALARAGVPYEIVPGITAALAAASALGQSLTDRRTASSVLLMTGHHADDLNPSLPPTRVVYMPGADLSIFAAAWLADGESANMPCVVISRVSQPDQSIVHTRLGELDRVEVAPAPALLLAGWVLQESSGLEGVLSDSELHKRLAEDLGAR